MNSFRISSRRAGSIFAAAAMVFATALPGLAAAATVTERSIELSSSTKATAAVSYKVKFNAQTDGTGAFLIDFCTTAAVGSACSAPGGLAVAATGAGPAGTSTATSGYTATQIDSNSVKVIITAPVDEDDPVELDVTGLTNPTAAGVIYARIVTYADNTALGSNTSAAPGTHYDDGSVALNITDGFSVSSAVLESLIFCMAENADTIGTGCTGTYDLPGLSLGTNGVLDLTPSEGTIKTQVSTNAVSGVVVNLKSSTPGGGLKRAEAATSDITPFNGTPNPSIGNGTAKFGLKLAGLSGVTASGSYSDSDYFLAYAGDNLSGVTSTYGSAIYSAPGPVSDATANLTFAANQSNTTPAGTYSTALNLIATGKF